MGDSQAVRGSARAEQVARAVLGRQCAWRSLQRNLPRLQSQMLDKVQKAHESLPSCPRSHLTPPASDLCAAGYQEWD